MVTGQLALFWQAPIYHDRVPEGRDSVSSMHTPGRSGQGHLSDIQEEDSERAIRVPQPSSPTKWKILSAKGPKLSARIRQNISVRMGQGWGKATST
jgi:hypothetical protein